MKQKNTNIAKKICLIGRFAVGKTCLVRRFVTQQFSHKYQTTVGVSISTKNICINNVDMSMVIWDIAGFEQDGHYVHYLRGVHGIIWVVDGTESESYTILKEISGTLPEIKNVPSICFINKCDLVNEWRITNRHINKLKLFNDKVITCSAKTGENVEEGFQSLACLLLRQ